MGDDGKTLLVGQGLTVYWRRRFILGLFSFLVLFQCTVWNTWGPVVNSVQAVYGWDTATISLFANWGSIAFMAFMVPVIYLQDTNLRAAAARRAALQRPRGARHLPPLPLFIVIPDLSDETFTVLCHIAAILNGIPGIVVASALAARLASFF